MPWPTWQQSAVLAIACLIGVLVVQRLAPGRWSDVAERACSELGIIAALYSVWRTARQLPLEQTSGAVDRARRIVEVQEWLGVPSELSLQELFLRWDSLGYAASLYYGGAHVPFLIAFLVWLFIRHPEAFGRWRNALALTTAGCLFIRFVRVAPPRFLPDLGYIDLPAEYGLSVYGEVGTGVSQQFAAMPSIHVAWAAVVSFGVVGASQRPWRWVALAHVVLTVLVVAGTGHHWWADGAVALVLLAIGLAVETGGRRLLASARQRRVEVPIVSAGFPASPGGP